MTDQCSESKFTFLVSASYLTANAFTFKINLLSYGKIMIPKEEIIFSQDV